MSEDYYFCSCLLCKNKNYGQSKRVSKATYFRHKSDPILPPTIEIDDSYQETEDFDREVTAGAYYENRYYSIKSQRLAFDIA